MPGAQRLTDRFGLVCSGSGQDVQALVVISSRFCLKAATQSSTVELRSHIERIVRDVAADPDEISVEMASQLEAMVDPIAVEHVVANLVTNALQYGAPPVTVSAECKDRHVRIVVEDRGEGVVPDFVPLLFERFRRSETSRG